MAISSKDIETLWGRYQTEGVNNPSFAAICTINNIKVVKYQQISAK